MCLNLNTSSVYRTQLPAPPRRGLRGHVTLEKKSLLKEISESCHDNTAGTSGLCALNDNWALPWLYIHVRWDLITYPIESSEHQNGGAANITMKVLVVLTIAVVSGCQANLFYADAPKPQLEVLTDAFWDYVAKATQTADDTLQMVRKSQFGQDVSARLTESADMASKYAVSIQEQLPPGAQDLITKVTTEADVLRERVTQELSTVRNKLEPYTEDMKAKIQARVEQLKQELAPYADSVDSEALRATLMQKSEELKSSLEQSVKDLQAQLGPYTDDLKLKVDGHLQNFQQNLAPMSDKFQLEFSQRASMVKQMVAPYAEDLREKLDPYAQDLQAQLMSLYQSFVNAN